VHNASIEPTLSDTFGERFSRETGNFKVYKSQNSEMKAMIESNNKRFFLSYDRLTGETVQSF
jgi:hypothetical protein